MYTHMYTPQLGIQLTLLSVTDAPVGGVRCVEDMPRRLGGSAIYEGTLQGEAFETFAFEHKRSTAVAR